MLLAEFVWYPLLSFITWIKFIKERGLKKFGRLPASGSNHLGRGGIPQSTLLGEWLEADYHGGAMCLLYFHPDWNYSPVLMWQDYQTFCWRCLELYKCLPEMKWISSIPTNYHWQKVKQIVISEWCIIYYIMANHLELYHASEINYSSAHPLLQILGALFHQWHSSVLLF